ncbi:inverse autotransporter beta domain-containing protein [Oceanisphaera pacifica]|uniref:Inverse autotransporter beta domain-containing protein n=1 Tax=Oceanisphaera pacifica TaxID=2818389 RepID=A0ABS3NII1_9GAMM|nr:inverse autotransporter beta domain-containing protein [Oceanisphaera pacifica]MBO1520355.1 inverse autotransporter beta domain-containing protein [Oceanisphaera pacifica]
MTSSLGLFLLLQILSIGLLASSAWAAMPLVAMHQVKEGETWRLLAEHYGLSERELRHDFNPQRFLVPLAAGDWVWVPNHADVASPQQLTQVQPATPPVITKAITKATTKTAPSRAQSQPQASALPQLGRPDPTSAPKADKVLFTLASAAKAAALNNIDKFVEQQSSHIADSTLSFGSRQLSSLLWLSPESWSWDYQLPLFDKDPQLRSRLALPVRRNWQGELGVDYRDDRLTYQAGLHFEQPLTHRISGHVEPILDYQAGQDHQRGGLLLFLEHPDWTLGAGQYQPLSDWQQQAGRQERPAAGQLLFGEGRLGWVPGLSISGEYYQWQGSQLDLYGSGDKYKAPLSRQWSLNYSPWQVLTLKSALLSNSKDKFESKISLGVELPLGVSPTQWWQSLTDTSRYDHYQPLQHHKVMVIEHQ